MCIIDLQLHVICAANLKLAVKKNVLATTMTFPLGQRSYLNDVQR
jgi:hypothetical protein